MRAKTEIDERRTVDVINADRLAGLLVNQLTLQRLVAFLENPQRFSLRNLVATIGKIAAGDLAHALFDHRQIRFGQRLRRNHVVEETVTRIVKQRRTNTQLGSGKQIEHRSGQQMRGRMTQDIQTFKRFRQHRFDLYRARRFAVRRA